ncbi:MAG: Ni/Fe hydrogenase subunit alpha [Motiliproteus sp.]|nr:Ni/Fe hydrogenase subunit alpha [Motiliproteus sp.]MCW9053131.1 Ni/Fe hydrogenase subunit alpha [Motiliproteus sp.]
MTESTTDSRSLTRVAIDPLTRVEGHGKVTLLLDENQVVQQARLHIVEFRGFERFIQGRPYWELPMVVQRLCGICPVSHHLAAGKAIDMLVGAEQLPPTAEKTRRLLHFAQVLQSHALHFFHLSSPDLLFGFSSKASERNIVGLLEKHPETALKGVKLRKFGQQLIETITGKRVHGSLVVPGGINKALKPAEINVYAKQMDEIIQWSTEALELAQGLYQADRKHADFGAIGSPTLSLCGNNGNFELYHGDLRVKDIDGTILLDHISNRDYLAHIEEEVKSWSYMKFPFLKRLGKDRGWYRVGPLARVLNCQQMDTPLAERARLELVNQCYPDQHQSVLLYHWARMIELLHCAESIQQVLKDSELTGGELVAPHGDRNPECYGIIEAPRGTLIHHYKVNDQDLVEEANLIVSTTSNNQAMNEAIRSVCRQYIDGHGVSEGLLNHIEVAVRAFDPCLSCATHALGKMPLSVEILSVAGHETQVLERTSQGEIQQRFYPC